MYTHILDPLVSYSSLETVQMRGNHVTLTANRLSSLFYNPDFINWLWIVIAVLDMYASVNYCSDPRFSSVFQLI